jgi:hypothetical protein
MWMNEMNSCYKAEWISLEVVEEERYHAEAE